MHIHVLGIAGTFMCGVAILAREAGHTVTGCDVNCYPPVSDLLADKGIAWQEGYEDTTQALKADLVVVGNAIKRGMPVLEAVLNQRKPYISGPQWLAEHVLCNYRVIAVAGTHGKTTTTSMIAHILEVCGLQPGFLIGGVAQNFHTSARLGKGEWFVIEADEYDTALFDKRPKFMHYRPQVAVLNNLEFDHADIYENLEAIKKQFHFYLRTIPSNGMVLKPRDDEALNEVISKGIYSNFEQLALDGEADWRAECEDDSGQRFKVFHRQEQVATVSWPLIGRFNVENALAAIAACAQAGVRPDMAANALQSFIPVKRRLEVKSDRHGVTVYDDFAHHPTAITKTIAALKASKRHQRIFAVLEFASYTMRTGVHAERMGEALREVDGALVLNPGQFDLSAQVQHWRCPYHILPDTHAIVAKMATLVKPGDAVLVMSNRGFENIHQQLVQAIDAKFV